MKTMVHHTAVSRALHRFPVSYDRNGNIKEKTSAYDVFLRFVTYVKGKCNASMILSKECYQAWLASRTQIPKSPEESFRRAVMSHLTRSSGRKPFPVDVEDSLLTVLRRKKVWECFEGSKGAGVNIGINGFKKLAYHERRRVMSKGLRNMKNGSVKSTSDVTDIMSTSFEVFNSFVTYDKDGKVDASGILSKECYDTWLSTRFCIPNRPGKTFRGAVISQLTGSDGRRTFSPETEASLLRVIRKKGIWPCFRGTNVNIGIRGFQKEGYHERQAKIKADSNVKKDATWKRAKREPIQGAVFPKIEIQCDAVFSQNETAVKGCIPADSKNDTTSFNCVRDSSYTIETKTDEGNLTIIEINKKSKKRTYRDMVDGSECHRIFMPNDCAYNQNINAVLSSLVKSHGKKRIWSALQLHEATEHLLFMQSNQNPADNFKTTRIRDFLFEVENQLFDDSKPVGTVVLDPNAYIVKMSITGAEQLGGVACLRSTDWSSCSRLQCGILPMNIMPILDCSNGKPIWFRKMAKTIDGKHKLFLIHIRKAPREMPFVYLAFQDITEHFPGAIDGSLMNNH